MMTFDATPMKPDGRRGLLLKLLLAAVLLAGCAGRPPAPEWQVSAHGSLQRYQLAWLAGATRAAEAEFAAARRQLASTGQAALVGRAELTRCALRVATLDFGPCEGFEPLAADAGAQERAYADWLQGRTLTPAEVASLPSQHRRAASAAQTGADASAAVRGIEDPLSRLVAAGVEVRRGQLTPSLVALGVETASRQGWRRPLLAWLGLELRQAESAGELAAAAQVRRRIELASQKPPE
jgi:alpha-D-ribose 1-methylphosphonate 5-triphosphate synthase subunit PhnG